MLLLIIGLAVTAYTENRKAEAAKEELASTKMQAEGAEREKTKAITEKDALQKQLTDANRQLTEAKEAARVLADAKTQGEKKIETSTADGVKLTAEIESLRRKLADSEARVTNVNTDLANARAQAATAQAEAAKAQAVESQRRAPPTSTLLDRPPRR